MAASSRPFSPSQPTKVPDAPPPSYSDIDSDQVREARAFMASTTTTTVTTTTQTTAFFSLPLWRRRAGPPMTASAMSEGSRPSTMYGRATEDGRIVRATSCNVDFNKELPDIPQYDEQVGPMFARRSTGMLHLPPVKRERESSMKKGRPSRSSTLMPPQAQTTRTLAQAGLGIGLPHVMPLAAGDAQRTSRPSTAPRPARREPSQEVRRVRSFSRIEVGLDTVTQDDDSRQITRSPKKSATLTVPNDNVIEQRVAGELLPTPSDAHRERKSLMRKASFWSRRRVQSLKAPSEAQAHLDTSEQVIPPPTLPAFQAISPMFSDRSVHSSPGSTPQSATFQQPARLRRRHSERSTSSHHSSRQDSSFSGDAPSSPSRSPHRPQPPKVAVSTHTASNGNASPLLGSQFRPVHSSFISSPAISRFPLVDQRQARPRSMTNPHNVLQRLSMGFFSSSSPSSPISSPSASTSMVDGAPVTSSPRHSGTLPRSSLSKSAIEIPKPRADEEPPEVFLGRLEDAVSKAEIAGILARSGDLYYTQALQIYIDRFDFTNDPLDIALRKLLMDVGLPKETQQIDRVMEAFAARYSKCNPNLFVSHDHPYILAFSLIMLHTDAFNRSNKRKMTKADYIKNTKLVGVSTEVLDYFFDNIVFAPFIFIEDPVDFNGQRGFTQDGRVPSGSPSTTPSLNGSGLSTRAKSNKVDAYYLIARDLLDSLRVDVETYIPLRNPFSYQGTAGSWNEAELRRSFARADVIEVDTMDAKRMSSLPFFSMNVAGVAGPVVSNFAAPALSDQESILSELSFLKVTKVGLLNRKDDLLDGGKRASSRKWKELWSVILTGSQLLFYRDSAVALNLIVQFQSQESEDSSAQISFLRPDELLSVKDAIAVYDSSYVKRDYVLRLVMPSGRQILLQTENELQRNEWIAHINYAGAFKSAGIRMRPVSATENARMDRSSYTYDAPQIPSRSTISISDRTSGDMVTKEASIISGIQDRFEYPQAQTSSIEEGINLHSRSRIVLAKIREFESKIETARAQLESDIRLVHNLAILTPFQRSTRDRLQTAVINLSRNIRQLRLEIVKATCFRDVLTAELASEEREQRSRRREEFEKKLQRDTEDSYRCAQSLSVDQDNASRNNSGRSLSRSDISEVSHGHADSSICESFHSALDFGTDWPRSTRTNTGAQRNITRMRSFEINSPTDTPAKEIPPGSSLTSGFFPSSPLAGSSSGGALGSSTSIDKSSAQRLSEEEAEEWDKTQAARRVSLVKVPASLNVTDIETRRKSFRSTKSHESRPLSENTEADAPDRPDGAVNN